MIPAEQDLARELARHPGWKWMQGMSADGPWGRWLCGNEPPKDFVPDLADPATQGCLWAALIKTDRFIRYESDAHRIELHHHDGDLHHVEWFEGDTLGEALARAWLAVNGGSDAA